MQILKVCKCFFLKGRHKDLLELTSNSNCIYLVRTVRTSAVPYRPVLLLKNSLRKTTISRDHVRHSSEKLKLDVKSVDHKSNFNIWKPLGIIILVGGFCTAVMLYLKHEKMLILEKERNRSIGKAAIGGKFDLVDQNNVKRTNADFIGKWLLIYFGFTHCPDICPDEIEKMVEVVKKIDNDRNMPPVQPVFITVDPERDTTTVIGKYLKEFSDKIIGLTGTMEQVAAACKAYRVYFSAGPKDKDSDYIVDHSIILYLVDPKGDFMDYYGQNKTADEIVSGIKFNVMKFEEQNRQGILTRLF